MLNEFFATVCSCRIGSNSFNGTSRWTNTSMWFPVLILVLVIHSSSSFNVDTKNTKIFRGPPGIYFGYSLAMLQNFRGNWLLVGAPKSFDPLQPRVRTPGVLLRCPLDRANAQCEQVAIDQSGNVVVAGVFYGAQKVLQHNKTEQWLGVAVDVSPADGRVMVCAHRWKDAKFVASSDLLYMQGLCYEIDGNFQRPARLLPALVDYNNIVHTIDRYPVWGYGMMGQSVQYSKLGDSVVMGAPGINDWQGGFVIEDRFRQNFTVQPTFETRKNWLIGYTVTTAVLDMSGLLYIVAGAPRANLHGSVFIFEYKKDTLSHPPLIGEQLGSYYGSVVCAVDVNNDNMDDILVGAPLFSSNKTDEGRVYVYLNRGPELGLELQTAVLNGSSSFAARFGSSIADIGDINKDSFSDIAIGAPYEDDGRGALYIYNGYGEGVWPIYTQKIRASDIDPGLRTFGNTITLRSINRGADFAVGAFMSDSAVLLKARPVVSMETKMVIRPSRITNSGPNLQLMPCFEYNGPEVSLASTLDLTYTLKIDTTTPESSARALVVPGYRPTVTRTITIRKEELVCEQDPVEVFAQYKDIWRDLQIEMTYDLANSSLQNCISCPILERFDGKHPETSGRYQLKKVIQYDKRCGDDNLCKTGLTMTVRPVLGDRSYIVADESKWLTVDVGILNSGENAYNVIVDVEVMGNLTSAIRTKDAGDALVDCPLFDENDESSIHRCYVRKPYPLQQGQGVSFNLLFPLGDLLERGEFAAHFKVRTIDAKAPEATEALRLPIKTLYDLEVEGISSPEQVTVTDMEATDTWSGVEHVYSIKNLGPSSVKASHFNVFVPIVVSKEDHLLKNVEAKVTRYNVKASSEACVTVGTMEEPPSSEPAGGYAVNVDCFSYTCRKFVCPLQTMEKLDSILVSVTLFVRGGIMQRLKVRDTLNLKSKIELPAADEGINAYHVTTVYHIRRDAIEIPTKTIPIWMVIVSVASALVVLMVIIAILIKVGFFRRSKKEEMKRLIETRDVFRKSMQQKSPDASKGGNPSSRRQSKEDMEDSVHANPLMELNGEMEDDAFTHKGYVSPGVGDSSAYNEKSDYPGIKGADEM